MTFQEFGPTAPADGFLRSVLDASTDCIKVVCPEGRLRFMNANGLRVMEIDDFAQVENRAWSDLWPVETAGTVLEAVAAARQGLPSRFEAFCPTAKGNPRWWEVSVSPILADDGAVSGAVSVSRDVTERREREEELQRYRTLVEQSSDFIGFATLDRRAVFANEGARRLVGAPPDVDLTKLEILDFFLPEDRDYVAEHIMPPQLAGEPWVGEFRFRHFVTGEPVPVLYNAFPIKDRDGRVSALATVTRNISARKRAEAALRSSEEHLRVAQMAGGIATWEWSVGTDSVSWSPTMADLLGIPRATEPAFQAFMERVHPDDAEAIGASVERALAGEPYEVEFRVVRPDGGIRWLAGRAEVIRDPSGAPVRMIGVNYDVTERRQATDALAALNAGLEARVRESAAKLVHLEKLESLGRLTGGIAHDFNNLLTVVMANLEVAQGRVASDPLATRLVRSAMRGAERGAALTARLLAFARRQDLHPTAVRVPELVAGMEDLITRALGPQIVVRTRFAPGLPPALVDPGQLEAAILNLAVNARDAMPVGGTLRIEADVTRAAVRDGEGARPYLRVSVADDGLGMCDETLRRAVEPFFTTKEVGKGTGLGLSTIHGLAEQSGGRFTLRSVRGQGTTAELLLPIADEVEEEGRSGDGALDGEAGTGLNVLVVDDDEAVLDAGAILIEALGHRVLRAGSGSEALRSLDAHPEVDVVVTDYLMPGMTGLEFARRARAARPSLPMILATGYADVVFERELELPRLSKPFRQAGLSAMLDQVAGRAGR